MSASGLRILGGDLRGRRILAPASSRPSGGRLREALFSIWMEEVRGARFLDVFAGSGAVALEALSRGADAATLVERDRGALSTLRKNLEVVRGRAVRLLASDASEALRRLSDEGAQFDLLFADPPYADRFDSAELGWLAALAAPGARMAVERRRGTGALEAPQGWISEGIRPYGDSQVQLFRRLEGRSDESP